MIKIDSLDNVYVLEINNKTQQIVLRYLRKYPNPKRDTIAHEIGMKFSFEQFISFLLPKNVFDDYIIFSNGKTVYETFPAGVSYVKSDSLLGIKNGMSASSLHDFNISGKDYKLFLQPVQFNSETEWVIAGLLTDKRYQVERKQLPFSIILFLITLALVLIVTVPWIKLFHMGSKDRLTVVDGVSSILVSMLLVSILFLSFFKYNLPFRTDSSPDSKKNLADSISLAFKKEIDSAYKKLSKYNKILDNKENLKKDIYYKNNSFRSFPDTIPIEKIDTLKDLSKDSDEYLSVNHLFWLNGNGDEIFKWTTDSFMPPHANYNAREYFKNIKENKTYFLKSLGKSDTAKFYLDQVMSWGNGAFASVLSIPYSEKSDAKVVKDTDTVAAAISFNVKSLVNTILPAGYQFALIDKDGKVLYHSQSSHNLNENLLDKFSANAELQSCLNSHAEGNFLTEYLSRKYNVKVKPLTDLPYFIVILSDTAFKETRDIEIYSFTFTMLVLFFAFIIIEMLIIFFASARKSFFKKQLFDTSWVGPKRSGHGDYLLSALFNSVVISVLIFFFLVPSFLTYGFILLFSVSFLTLFLNCLYYIRYKAENSFKYLFKRTAICIMTVLILIIDIAGYRMLDWNHFIYLIIYELSLFVIGASIILIRKKYLKWKTLPNRSVFLKVFNTINKPAFVNKEKNYISSFTLMVISRLIVTSGIPVLFFYIGSYNYEQNLIIRYKLSEFANQVIEKLPSDSLKARNMITNRQAIYNDGAWIKEIAIDNLHSENYTKEDSITIQLLSGFRPDITPEAIAEKKFYLSNSADSLFFLNPIMKNAGTQDSGMIMYRKTNIPGVNIKLTSTGLNYNFPILIHYKGSWFWVFLLFAFVLFFFLLRNIIKKLFSIKIPDLAVWQQLDENILCDNKINNRIFVIGPPGVKKRRQILQKIMDGKIKTKDNEKLDPADTVFVADLINIPDSEKDAEGNKKWEDCKNGAINHKIKLVIVSHFEYNIENAYANSIKLNFLESLMLNDTEKIMILSTVHPMAFLDSIFFGEKKKKDKSESSDESSIPHQDFERWNVLLGHYAIVLMPLGSYSEKGEVEVQTNDPLEESINTEIKMAQFLNKMKAASVTTAHNVEAAAKKDGKDFNLEELAFKLQLTSHYFYMYIWQSLTKEEKFLLYDLAEDNLVNSYDDHNLGLLIGKGLIWRDDGGTLKLFNKGFRNFILTAIGNSEAMKIKDRIKDNGNWGKWRTPLIIIFLAILFFLMVSQEETYTKLLTYIGALGAGIPVFLRLLSFFDKNPQKSS